MKFKSAAQKQRISDATTALEAEYREGFEEGVSEGIAVARRILVWWSANEQLAHPQEHKTLKEWSEGAINELRDKLKQ